ncbi:hypothetical protein ACFOUP_01965 [Belliella kenyensis]|uniref:Outer membrane protein beta-barrel domain-containing protein n=1 Tax=Belliella kenyensis TaxID=1472724 RepID=A0ABV8EFU2_9BACT|nr:hypothetical protein [Belliella kenyensis]MCH7401039.1 hypothetical protein [Belliella kenyensis]MDN3604037.1 hypothetical protein [Belliella kenyensis]
MKKLLTVAMMMVAFLANAQEDGIGIRLGEPLSITYKKFLDGNIAIEGMFGRAGANSAQYYFRSFDNNRPTSNAFYAGHSTGSSFSFNVRGAYHEDITDDLNIDQGYLLAYAGAGLQLRSTRVDYTYTDPSVSPTGIFYRESRRNIDIGPEIFGGSEYYFDDLPISIFAEIGLFMELLDRFGHVKLQGGIGVRYLF